MFRDKCIGACPPLTRWLLAHPWLAALWKAGLLRTPTALGRVSRAREDRQSTDRAIAISKRFIFSKRASIGLASLRSGRVKWMLLPRHCTGGDSVVRGTIPTTQVSGLSSRANGQSSAVIFTFEPVGRLYVGFHHGNWLLVPFARRCQCSSRCLLHRPRR